MSSIVEQIYLQQVKALPVTERLLLTRLIMDDLSKSVSRWVVDSDDAWSDEDLSDLSRASLLYSAQMLGEEDYDETW